MSFLYHKHTKRALKWIWGIIAILIVFSMVFAYSGGIQGLFSVFAYSGGIQGLFSVFAG